MAVPFPKVNGHYPQFADIECDLDGFDLGVGITSIDYSDTLEPGDVRGASPQLLGKTRGEYSAEASIEMPRPHFDAMVDRLGDGWMERIFNINATVRVDDDSPVVTDNIVRCRVKKSSHSSSTGNDPLKVKIDLAPEGICWKGKLPFAGFRR